MPIVACKRSWIRIQCPKCSHQKAWVYPNHFRCTSCGNEFEK